jgi:hypothetical protein
MFCINVWKPGHGVSSELAVIEANEVIGTNGTKCLSYAVREGAVSNEVADQILEKVKAGEKRGLTDGFEWEKKQGSYPA